MEFINEAVVIITTALTGLILLLADFIWIKSGNERLSRDSEIRNYLQEAIENGISYGVSLVIKHDDKRDIDKVHAHAVEYIKNQVPDAVNHFNLDDKGLERLVIASTNKKTR